MNNSVSSFDITSLGSGYSKIRGWCKMKSHFGEVKITTNRAWTMQELYLALQPYKEEFHTPPQLRNYGDENGLYMDGVGIYTIYFQPGVLSGVTMKLWCPWYHMRTPLSRHGSTNSTWPGKEEAVPLLEKEADKVSRILAEAEEKQLEFDTTGLPQKEAYGLDFRHYLPLIVAEEKREFTESSFLPPECLEEGKKQEILKRCEGQIKPEDVVYYVLTKNLFAPEQALVITEQGIFGTGKTTCSILFDNVENVNVIRESVQNQMIVNILEKVEKYKNEAI